MNIVASRSLAGLAFDVSVKTTPTLRAALKQRGGICIPRYVPLPGNNPVEDIDQEELEGILSDGFGSWFVQHPRFPGWKPRECDPEADALWAVKYAKLAGYAPLTHGFVDSEGMSADTTEADSFVYNSKFTHVLVEEGYSGGVYDGYSDMMTPVEIYEIADATAYWSDLADRKVAVRGTSVVQHAEIVVAGVRVDPDTIRPDLKNLTPFWSIAA
jgi:hypothetical protein